MPIKKHTRAVTLAEVMVALVIIAVCAVPVFYALTSSRTDTSKAINYLRAVELANEAIEWAMSVDFDKLNNETMSAFTGSLVEENSDESALDPNDPKLKTKRDFFAASVGADDKPANKHWQNLDADWFSYSELTYSDDYNKAFYVREIEVEPIESSSFAKNLIKKVTVLVKWNEGHTPSSLNSFDRDRQIELSTLVFNDQSLEY